MPLVNSTTTATTTTMESNLGESSSLAVPIRQQNLTSHSEYGNIIPSSANTEFEFDESQCLFCSHVSLDQDKNLAHMSNAHGFQIDMENLVVGIRSLLAHFHLVVVGQHRCLYCGTRRKNCQAVQQHMIAKGHCKYEVMEEDEQMRVFYDFSSLGPKDEIHRNIISMSCVTDFQLPSQARSRRPLPPRRSEYHGRDRRYSSVDNMESLATQQPHTNAVGTSSTTHTSSHSLGELSTRALKQEFMLSNQLSRLRAEDRRSLLHLPASQQRALLATHHKQMEQARRTEQIYRGNLESAANKFGCLSKIKLIRKPPHTGNVRSLRC